MRCREGVTGTVDAMGAIEAFGMPQARAIGRRRAVTLGRQIAEKTGAWSAPVFSVKMRCTMR